MGAWVSNLVLLKILGPWFRLLIFSEGHCSMMGIPYSMPLSVGACLAIVVHALSIQTVENRPLVVRKSLAALPSDAKFKLPEVQDRSS